MSETTTETASEPAFPLVRGRRRGYHRGAVDAFLENARRSFEGEDDEAGVTAAAIRSVSFPLVKSGYEVRAVDAALVRIEDAFAARERREALEAHGAQAWVERARDDAQVILERLSRARGHRFARVGWLRFGYRVDEVDIVTDKLIGYFERGVSVSVEQVRGVAFRMQRGGYREEQVDAVLDAVVDVMLAVR
ncbi:DivIVA domain-containing protein [Microbacterium sp. LRZ72]|uniref:DivIVA domain-containing protein n=1 Tax=Microbacterium sp. LRZ72 TaxID=2942481 RepID=UPI0029A0F9D8|nr:DivIVA domain-containing protein [Microbacterium sp. LRZ72]MDX2375558.1 DivIVA domain-containing protein [Microbacterium sp. LRZ72]